MGVNSSKTISKVAASIALLAMVGGGIGVGAFLLTSGGDRDQGATSTSRPAPPPRLPIAREFTVGVVVTATNCDPAGECVYTYTIEPKYIGMIPLPEKELRVDYRVDGGHQPQDGAFSVNHDEARFLKDVPLTGPPGATLTATVVDVVEAPMQGPSVSPAPLAPPAPPSPAPAQP